MPMTPELRRGSERNRDYLFGGGYPNPAQNAEQLSFLIYFYMHEASGGPIRGSEPQSNRMPPRTSVLMRGNGTCVTCATPENPASRAVPRELLRWSSWAPSTKW